jgi:hypothetical protein
MDRLAAAGFAVGGLLGADAARALCVAVPVFAGFWAIAWICKKLPADLQNRIRLGLLIAALLITGLCAFEVFQASRSDIRDIRLLAAVDLFEQAGEGRVFLNAPALSAARLLSPDFASRAPDARSIQPLSSSPVRWREEDRSAPFQAILLAVPLEDSRPLVEMLNSTPEWHLAKIDNQGLLYRRGTTEQHPQSIETVFANKRDSALHDAQTAMVMHFLGKNKDAREWMAQARQTAPSDPLVLTQSATLAAALKQWPTTKKEAELALKEDPPLPSSRPATSPVQPGNRPISPPRLQTPLPSYGCRPGYRERQTTPPPKSPSSKNSSPWHKSKKRNQRSSTSTSPKPGRSADSPPKHSKTTTPL